MPKRNLASSGLDGTIIASFLELKFLESFNLSGNRLSGEIPSLLKERSNNGSLLLSVDGNPDLCLVGPCEEDKKNIVPLVAGILSAAVFSIVLGTVLTVIWRRRCFRKPDARRERLSWRQRIQIAVDAAQESLKKLIVNHTKMNINSTEALFVLFAFVFLAWGNAQNTLVPAIITFGDSAVDVGNNDYLPTLFKANYPPYGRDFVNHQPTGRFCNGKLATDITAETLGFKRYAPAYLSPQASGKNLLIGANFASAASGYDEKAAILNHAIPLSQQLKYYKEYQGKLTKVAGRKKAALIVKDALYILSAGSSDFVQNYYVNPLINKAFTPDQYSGYLVGAFSSFVKDLYRLGARKVGVTSLPPLGCLPAARTLFGFHKNGCVSRINNDAQGFNKKIKSAAANLQKQLPGLKIVIFDIYKPLFDLVLSPSKFGFVDARRGCCGTGRVETTSLLCNPKSLGTCSNATQYVFWDSVHPSQAANQVLADALIVQGIALIT
ncbi:GDSL esterase/lipase APG [Spatholobus suberectus]|nr:GDSL esterase/lipase APG [Spatholobus suberectus]